MTTAKRALSRRVHTKGSTSRSSTRRVEKRSISSLLGELGDEPDTDIRSVTLEELKEMHARGELHPTAPDAPTIELDEEFWRNAVLVMPGDRKASVHLRLDPDVLAWFKRQGKGHLTRMNAVLRAYYEANRKKPKKKAS